MASADWADPSVCVERRRRTWTCLNFDEEQGRLLGVCCFYLAVADWCSACSLRARPGQRQLGLRAAREASNRPGCSREPIAPMSPSPVYAPSTLDQLSSRAT